MPKRLVLKKLDHLPSSVELEDLLRLAEKEEESTASLPFIDENYHEFSLSVSFAFSTGDTPKWYLFNSDKDGSRLLWTATTSHVALVAARIVDIMMEKHYQAPKPTNVTNSMGAASAQKIVPVLPEPVSFNASAYSACLQSVTDKNSTLLTEGCLFWFLGIEFDRFQRFKIPFAFLMVALPPETQVSMSEISAVIKSSIRSLDLPFLYEGNCAILLPHSAVHEAQSCAERLTRKLMSLLTSSSGTAKFGIGIAGLPDTCDHPGILVSAALEAAQFARERETQMAVFGTD